MFNFTYNLTEADYFEFNRHHTFGNQSTQKVIIVMRIFLAAFMSFIILLNLISGGGMGSLIFPVILGLAVIFGFKPLMLLSIKWQIKLIKKQGKLPFGKDVNIRFDEESYVETNEVSETKINYTSLERVVKGHHVIYLYIGAMQATIIPFAAFETDEQRDDFLTFIINKTPIKPNRNAAS